MKQSLLVLVIFIAVSFAQDKPLGGYKSLYDYHDNIVTIPVEKIVVKKNVSSRSSELVKVYCKREDGKLKKWSNRKHGPMKIAVLEDGTYLLPQNTTLNIVGDYAWFEQVESEYYTNSSGGTSSRTIVVTYAIDLRTGKWKKFDVMFMTKLLMNTPALLQEFSSQGNMQNRLIEYLHKYNDEVQRLNSEPQPDAL